MIRYLDFALRGRDAAQRREHIFDGIASGVKMRLALYQPDNPRNVGGAIRLAACFNAPLDIIEPCGFPLIDKDIRRSALDYEARAEIVRHRGWNSFCDDEARRAGRLVLFTTRADAAYWDEHYRTGDTLLFGRESAGAPEHVHDAADIRVRIPVAGRSLNLVVAAGIALGEAARQVHMRATRADI